MKQLSILVLLFSINVFAMRDSDREPTIRVNSYQAEEEVVRTPSSQTESDTVAKTEETGTDTQSTDEESTTSRKTIDTHR